MNGGQQTTGIGPLPRLSLTCRSWKRQLMAKWFAVGLSSHDTIIPHTLLQPPSSSSASQDTS